MESSLILIVVAFGVFVIIGIYFFIKPKSDGQEKNLTASSDIEDDLPEKEPSLRPHLAYQENTNSILSFIVKSGPKMVVKVLISYTIVSLLTGYVSIKNAERFADVGAALAHGDIITAVSSAFAFGREPTIEFKNVSVGKNSYLDENGLNEFAYIGKEEGLGYAVMKVVYSTQHHDPYLKTDDPIYNKPMKGMSVSEARDFCQDKYGNHNGDLISIEDWITSQSNFLGRNNFTIPEEPEWTRTAHKDDADDYLVIPREFNVAKYVEDEKIDNEEEGQYIDGDDSDKFLFRCSVKWEIKE